MSGRTRPQRAAARSRLTRSRTSACCSNAIRSAAAIKPWVGRTQASLAVRPARGRRQPSRSSSPHRDLSKFEHIDQADKVMHTRHVEAVPAFALRIFAIAREIGLAGVGVGVSEARKLFWTWRCREASISARNCAAPRLRPKPNGASSSIRRRGESHCVLETHLGGGIFGKRWRSPPRLTQGCALSQ